MLTDIYARSFLTATRTDGLRLQDIPSAAPKSRRGWFKRIIFGPKTRVLRDISDL